MQLKCIGGHCDNQVQYADDTLKVGDCVRVSEPMKLAATDAEKDFQDNLTAFIEGRPPESMLIKYHLYRICAIHGTSLNGDRQIIKYLCPYDWHEWEAIAHQFGT